MNEFEDKLHEERLRVGEFCSGILHQFLQSMKEVDERLRLVSASSLPDGSGHATEAYGLSHDEGVIIDKSEFIVPIIKEQDK